MPGDGHDDEGVAEDGDQHGRAHCQDPQIVPKHYLVVNNNNTNKIPNNSHDPQVVPKHYLVVNNNNTNNNPNNSQDPQVVSKNHLVGNNNNHINNIFKDLHLFLKIPILKSMSQPSVLMFAFFSPPIYEYCLFSPRRCFPSLAKKKRRYYRP